MDLRWVGRNESLSNYICYSSLHLLQFIKNKVNWFFKRGNGRLVFGILSILLNDVPRHRDIMRISLTKKANERFMASTPEQFISTWTLHKHPNIASTPEHCINAQTLHQHRNIHQYHSKLESTPKLLGPFSMFCCRGIVKKHLWCSIIRSKSAFYERYMYQQYRLIIYFAKLNPNFSFSWAEMVFNLDLSFPPY